MDKDILFIDNQKQLKLFISEEDVKNISINQNELIISSNTLLMRIIANKSKSKKKNLNLTNLNLTVEFIIKGKLITIKEIKGKFDTYILRLGNLNILANETEDKSIRWYISKINY